jgi:nitrogen fixation/metabolism regulation signal transduction histidine kinase
MRQLYPSELKSILKELQKQKIMEEYSEQRNRWTFLAAVITNCTAVLAKVFSGKKGKIKTIEAEDFLSKDFKAIVQKILGKPKSKKIFDKHIKDAKQKGLKGPW